MAGVANYPWQQHYYLRFDKINDFVDKTEHFYIRKRDNNGWWKVTHFCAKVGVALQIPFLLVESVACHLLRFTFHVTLGVFTLDYRQFIYGIIDLISLAVETVALPFIGLCFFFSTSRGEDKIVKGLKSIDRSAPRFYPFPKYNLFNDNWGPTFLFEASCHHPIALREIVSRDSKAFNLTQALLLLFSYPKILVDLSSNIVRLPLLAERVYGVASLVSLITVTVAHFVRPFLPKDPHPGLKPGELWAVDPNIYSYSALLGLDIDAISGKRAPLPPPGDYAPSVHPEDL